MKKRVLFFTLNFTFLIVCKAQVGVITTVAGNGDRSAGAFSGDGGLASAAELGSLGGLAFDASGNYYIVDAGNNRIRMVSKSTGIINTVVGGGIGDDSVPATTSHLNEPNGIAIDKSGNIYIADVMDNAIRKVDSSTGIINTVAGTLGILNKAYLGDGGQATAAFLDEPTGVALDDTGNIYISDFHNNVIRKVTISTGIITTVAGNGYGYWNGSGSWTGAYAGNGGQATAASFYGPIAITFDVSQNMYVADCENNVIRKITKTTGIINTVAGNGTEGYSGDGDSATVAELWTPTGITIDSLGNLFIGDNSNDVIRKVNTLGIITTFIGNGVLGYSGDGGQATSAELRYPNGVTLDALGNIYLPDAANYVVRKVTDNTTGINEIKKNDKIAVFPNPGNGNFIFSLSNPNERYNLEVFNSLGEKILTEALPQDQEDKINLTKQPNGIYLYRILKLDGSLEGEGKLIVAK